MPITSLDDLRRHLQWAIELEHSTIPPYLCALYSIKPGSNREAVDAIASVVIEEMLHMTLAANVLNAIGGTPVIDRPDFIPRYPAFLPHSANAFQVPLARFSPETIDIFMKIERPEAPQAPPESDRFDTIGQFYRAIGDALQELSRTLGETAVFSGDRSRQITPQALTYRGSGRIVAVSDLASAQAAIAEIEDQGEGLRHNEVWDGDRDMFHAEREEVAHYFRFVELKEGRAYKRGDTPQSGPSGPAFAVDWNAVYPMRSNPKSADFPAGSEIRAQMDAFNALYSEVLRALDRAFNGDPAELAVSVAAMLEMKQVAQALLQMPTGDGATTAGPSFEYVPREAVADAAMTVTVMPNGPYVVHGAPLTRKAIVYSELHEPSTWRKTADLETEKVYRLCRCGQSSQKPFCDATHLRVNFDGTERASTRPTAKAQHRFEGSHITMTDDRRLCTHAGFCGNKVEKVWDMIERTDDTRVRFQLMQMVERCPGGRLGYELHDIKHNVEQGPIEPDLPAAIAVTKDGPYWVTGGIPVTMSDGRTLEVRNRVALCRCGQSANKPLCDGTHTEIKFREG